MCLSIGASVLGYPFESFDEVTHEMSHAYCFALNNKTTLLWFAIIYIFLSITTLCSRA